MTLGARSCAAALVIAALALYTEPARADIAAGAGPAGPSCAVALASSRDGVTLPANAPALLVVNRSYGGITPTIKGAFVNGTTRTDLAVGTDTHGLWTLTLPTPNAAPGTYSVEVATTCGIPNEQKLVMPLTLTEPVSLPTSVGTLVHVPSDPPKGVDKVRLDPTPSMRAFLPAARLELVVDGTKAETSPFVSASSPIELTVNTGGACIENGALHREKRTVKVTIEGAIAGVAASPAPASIDIPVDCGAIEWTSGFDVDDDGNARAGSNGTSASPAGSTEAAGCSASPVAACPGGPGLFALALGGLGFVAMGRRRRR